jgi:tRNA1(Val) A37 N6-methylase TrmN6
MRAWITRLSGALRSRGSLTVIVPAGMVPACLLAMTEADSPCTAIFPLWPKAGRAAKLVMLRGVRQTRTPMRLMPGLILHQPDGSFTREAQAVLREGAGLDIDC